MTALQHIVIAEPSDVVRRGVRAILEESAGGLSVALKEVSTVEQLRAALFAAPVDILVVNPSLMAFPSVGVRCVMLQTTLADGAKAGLFDEVISICDSAEAIRRKLSGLVGDVRPLQRHTTPLSRREKEIVVCLVKGMTNRNIADTLHLSPHTVGTHRRNISAKLDIHSTSGLTVYAISNKLVRLDELHKGE